MNKLKPCPYCGAFGNQLELYTQIHGYMELTCQRCNKTLVFVNINSKDEAIEAWNTRTTPSLLALCEGARKDIDGKCYGYQRDIEDDEPSEMCKECSFSLFYENPND